MQNWFRISCKHLDTLLYGAAFLLPFTSLLAQEALLRLEGIQLRPGNAIFNMLGTGIVGLVGFLLLARRLYQAYKVKVFPPVMQLGLIAFAVSMAFAAAGLALSDPDDFCGGHFGDCGRWI